MAKRNSFESTRQTIELQRWRDRLSALRYVLPMLKLVWEAHHLFTVAIVALRLIRSCVPVAILWVGKLIMDTIIALREGSVDSNRLWKLIAFEIAIVVMRDLLARISDLVESLLGDLLSRHTSVLLMAHASTLDLYQFEDPEFHDQFERARHQTAGRLGIVDQLLSMVQDLLTLVSLGAALIMYSPLLLLLLVVTVFPRFFGEVYFATLEYSLFRHRTGDRRRLDYLRSVAASGMTAKEIQLYGLSPWLISRFQRLSQLFYDETKHLLIRKATIISAISLIGTLGYYTAYAIILMRTVNGSITLGTLTFLVGSFARARDLIQAQVREASNFLSQALFLKDLFDFFSLKPSITSPPGSPAVPQQHSNGIEFEDVSFRYPGSDSYVLHHVSFKINPSERIALVGENGAGKTTVTKLLARLYEPTEGRILLDGRDIREYDLKSYRRTIGVIFQDFVCYDWRFDENIGIGEIEKVKSYLDSFEALSTAVRKKHMYKSKIEEGDVISLLPPCIVSAAEKSLASTLLPRFSEGYRQMLGRRFDQGIELSGGEWQKIALARAYMRDAQVLILDEPTAALDARAEYEVFARFSQLVTGRMAVIISHRFSTVRMADRIIVLRNGVITEEGTHYDLMAKGGLYAELFNLQSEGYR
jgi:ATP-binding cassette, subfamily B, bacterial